jgi:hypothetical protein
MSRESRCRSKAARNGCKLMKSRGAVSSVNLGEYMLVDRHDNIALLGGCFDASLDDIEIYLRSAA